MEGELGEFATTILFFKLKFEIFTRTVSRVIHSTNVLGTYISYRYSSLEAPVDTCI